MVGPTEDHRHGHGGSGLAVAPVCERLGADPTLTGRGVTIAFLDSGFSPHPDLTRQGKRIRAYADVTGEDAPLAPAGEAEGWRWHGTQTSVVAAGNGHLSGGAYRGLASQAGVVLVKVGAAGRISEENIGRGLAWVLENREHHRIRVVSISLGGDEDTPLPENRVNQLAEECVRAGLVLVVAAGNSGCSDRHRSLPPATAPSVITVGGYEETGDGDAASFSLYCGSYGFTADGLVKPEIIALARGVAAPVLPGTEAFRTAEAFYQDVDGTSFAAPIVASVVAQMLEVNPNLTPAGVKDLLVRTARRIAGAPAFRQGFGVLAARPAVEAARAEKHACDAAALGPTLLGAGRAIFVYHDDEAETVSLAGEFNGWQPAPLSRGSDGSWRTEVAGLSPGSYRYKFVVDGRWIEDPSHGAKEPDPYGSFNSLLRVS